jgi:hypothetical protein
MSDAKVPTIQGQMDTGSMLATYTESVDWYKYCSLYYHFIVRFYYYYCDCILRIFFLDTPCHKIVDSTDRH